MFWCQSKHEDQDAPLIHALWARYTRSPVIPAKTSPSPAPTPNASSFAQLPASRLGRRVRAQAGIGALASAKFAARRLLALGFAAALIVLAAALAPAPSLAAGCPNEAVRAAESATSLPDCRAYELVSPAEGTPFLEGGTHKAFGARAASAGGGVAWVSAYPLSSSLGGGLFDLSKREPAGWVTADVAPRLSATNSSDARCKAAMFFSADLSQAVVTDGFHSAGVGQGSADTCGSNDPPLIPGEPEGFQNTFLRDGASGLYQLVDVTPATVTPADAVFQDASEDFSHVVFEDEAKLTEASPVGASLYEWAAGVVHLVTVSPGGTPTNGSLPGAFGVESFAEGGAAPLTHPVSADGTRVVFEAAGKLYLRENADRAQSPIGLKGECIEGTMACTVQLDGSLGGGGGFLAANAEDTKIYFSDSVAGSGQHLYEYDTSTDGLTDLTPTGELGLQGLSGISTDGSYLYAVATATLAEGAAAGQPNLYLFHNGAIMFIATLEAGKPESTDWTPGQSTSVVSPNGRYIGFDSMRSLTEYDNTPAQPSDCQREAASAPCEEAYLFDSSRPRAPGNPACVSCDPNGARPTGPTELQGAEESSSFSPAPVYPHRNVLDDGRMFFDSPNSLVAAAANGVSNVYEYAAGQLSLISSGSSATDSVFYDASAAGQDVFFVTTQHLVRSDTAAGDRLYDARVDGGFLEADAPASCSGEGCRGSVPTGALSSVLATVGPQALGNLSPPPFKPKATVLSKRQKLERALRACRRDKRPRRRAACVRRARGRYGARLPRTKRAGGK